MKASLLKKKYVEAIPELKKTLRKGNALSLPKIAKVTVNVGVGKFLKEQSHVDEILETLAVITGQKPVLTKTRKAIAGFKIREGLDVGAKVTLRGRRMWGFLDRLFFATLPRVRDFQGIPRNAIDGAGNANIGLREHVIFPEIIPEKVQTIFGLQITITTTAKDKKEGEALFCSLGFPFQAEE